MSDIDTKIRNGFASFFSGSRPTPFIGLLLAAFLLFYVDWPRSRGGMGFGGLDIFAINFFHIRNVIGGLIWISFLLAAIYLIRKGFNIDPGEGRIILITALHISFYIAFGAIRNLGAFLHLILPWLIIKTCTEENQPLTSKLVTLNVFYFIDFIGYGLVARFYNLLGIRFVLPIYVIYAAFKGAQYAEGFGKLFYQSINFLIILLVFGMIGQQVITYDKIASTTTRELNSAQRILMNSVKNLKATFAAMITPIARIFDPNYYAPPPTSPQPQDQYIYLEATSSDKDFTFKPNEKFAMSVRVRKSDIVSSDSASAKLFEQEVDIKLSCEAEGEEKKIKGSFSDLGMDDTTTIKLGRKAKAESTQCYFSLPEGQYNINFIGTFDFSGYAKRKIYLTKDLEKEVPDDHSSTSGPVSIVIDIDSNKWELNSLKKRFGISLSGNWDTSKGEIMKINGLYAILPKTMKFVTPACNNPTSNLGFAENYDFYRIDLSALKKGQSSYSVDCYVDTGNSPVGEDYLQVWVDYTYRFKNSVAFVNIEDLKNTEDEGVA